MWQSLTSSVPGLELLGRASRDLYTSVIERRYLQLLALANFLAVLLTAGIAKVVYIDFGLGSEQAHLPYLLPACILACVLHYALKEFGLHTIASLNGPTIGFGRIWAALALSFLLVLGGMYLMKVAEDYSRVWFLLWFALAAAALIAVRLSFTALSRRLVAAGQLKRHVALLGTPEYVEMVRAELEKESQGISLTTTFIPPRMACAHAADLDAISALKTQLQSRGIEQVVIALPPTDQLRIRAALRQLAPVSHEILLCTDLQSLPVPVHGSKALGRLRAEVASPIPAVEKGWLEKRTFDLLLATIGIIALLPMLALVALAIKLDSPGPVFFRQRRYGMHNRVFRIFKFRTMHVQEDDARVEQAVRNDARVTRLGRFLRASSIDEIPQLFNVLLGHMSLVGPRPHALAHEEKFEESLDLFSLRRRVLPGITGWAQVNGCRGETKGLDCVKDRMEYDLYYIDNWSIWLDVEILVRTVVTTLRGAY